MQYAAVIPAYNEANTIREVARATLKQGVRVIVVDDGSHDATTDQLSDLPVELVTHKHNQGKAAALFSGFEHALRSGAEAVITLDADGQHRPEDIPRLLGCYDHGARDIVIGARSGDAPRLRRFANRFADFWISWAAGYRIVDTQTGFRVYPAQLLRECRLPHGPDNGFVFESEVLIEAAYRGFYSKGVDIASIYRPGARASHYRPWRDTWRITRMVAGKLLKRGLYPQGLIRVLASSVYAWVAAPARSMAPGRQQNP